MNRPIILIVGTRPEAIKLAPVYAALKRQHVPVLFCSTGQHSSLLKEVLDLFNIVPDVSFNIMQAGQNLFDITTAVLRKSQELFMLHDPSLVIVHGDTTSAMAAALAAFYVQIPVAHVEAGLRTFDVGAPFPEEMNRQFIGMVGSYHFAPTALATSYLLAEGVSHNRVIQTGNTVVDALRIIKEKIISGDLVPSEPVRNFVAQCKAEGKQCVPLTVHRRESFNGGLERIFSAIKEWAAAHDNVNFFYARHPNPRVVQAVEEVGLDACLTITVSEPVSYLDMVYLLLEADWVVTDSGGIQEEAVSLGKHVIVAREKTERMEAIWAGLAHLAGTHKQQIMSLMDKLSSQVGLVCEGSQQLYGDGFAAQKIVTALTSNQGTFNLVQRKESTQKECM